MMTWKKLELDKDVWKPINEGDTLEGVVIERTTDQHYGTQLIISYNNGEYIKTPFHKILQAYIDSNDVKVGDRIKIVFTGMKNTGKGNPATMYSVYKWADNGASE